MRKNSGKFSIRHLAAAKLMLVGALILFYTDNLRVGENPISAQNPPGEDAQKAQPEAPTGPEVPKAAATNETTTKRKSFLEGLLDLPELDRGTAKREEINRFLDLAEQKERQVKQRIELLKAREVQLKELEVLVEGKIRALEEERFEFESSIQREKKIATERLDYLVNFYQKMDAKKAAPVMEQLDKDLVVQLFQRIPEKQVMNVLSAMSPEKSVEITEYYGRIRSGREYEMLREMNRSLAQTFADKCTGLNETKTPAASH